MIARDILASMENCSDVVVTKMLPLVSPMRHFTKLDDIDGYDSGRDVVVRFLSCAGIWRGHEARRIKAELRNILKAKE
jgi:hypothetical protein